MRGYASPVDCLAASKRITDFDKRHRRRCSKCPPQCVEWLAISRMIDIHNRRHMETRGCGR